MLAGYRQIGSRFNQKILADWPQLSLATNHKMSHSVLPIEPVNILCKQTAAEIKQNQQNLIADWQ